MVVVSNDAIHHPSAYVVVARTTKNPKRAGLPTVVELEPGEANMPERTWILCHDLYTIRASAVEERPFGELPADKRTELDVKLRYALGL